MSLFKVTKIKGLKVTLKSTDHKALDEAKQELTWVYPRGTIVDDKVGHQYHVTVARMVRK